MIIIRDGKEIKLIDKELHDAHKEFVVNWMAAAAIEIIKDDYDYDGFSDKELIEFGEQAYELYSSGNGHTEYEAVLDIVSNLEEKMIEFIGDYWDLLGMGEIDMSPEEAAVFLGCDTSDMDQYEIDEQVNEIQMAYYTEYEATFDELVNKYKEMKELLKEREE